MDLPAYLPTIEGQAGQLGIYVSKLDNEFLSI